jgi:hypothetical protein
MELFTQLFGDLLVFVYHCFDRSVIYGYLSHLSRPEQVVHFFRDVVGVAAVNKEVLTQRTADYQAWVEAFARNHRPPIEWAEKGVRKEEDQMFCGLLSPALLSRHCPGTGVVSAIVSALSPRGKKFQARRHRSVAADKLREMGHAIVPLQVTLPPARHRETSLARPPEQPSRLSSAAARPVYRLRQSRPHAQAAPVTNCSLRWRASVHPS